MFLQPEVVNAVTFNRMYAGLNMGKENRGTKGIAANSA